MTVKILMDAPLAPVRFEIFALVAAGFLSVSCSAKTQAPPSTDDFSTVSTLKKTPDEVRASRPPNILVIMADDLGYGDLGCYGSTRHETPHIDALATGGLRFTDFHSAGPMCSPTRAALLTGQYQQRFGRIFDTAISGTEHRDLGLPHDAVTIAEQLKAQGYATACFGKWHLG
ncbi:MAG: sulfatase-like hydrolase/transferase, partial [Parvularculaceae bacterium]|nr:sulfatase-like hydrolase/transferase [Parvularculaceae bacterium]